MPTATIVIILSCLFLQLSSGENHLVTTDNKDQYIVETKSDGNQMDFLDSNAGTNSDSKHQAKEVKSKQRSNTRPKKGIKYLVRTGSGSNIYDYIVEFDYFKTGKKSEENN